MKTSVLFFSLLSLSLTSVAGVNYGGWEYENYAPSFSVSVPQAAVMTSKSGNCFIERVEFVDSTWHLSLNEQDGNSVNEVARLLFDSAGHLLVQSGAGALSSCGNNNEASVEKSAAGKVLKVKCSGNPIAGEGSGQIEIKSGAQNQLLSISVEYRNGWYQSFSGGKIECGF